MISLSEVPNGLPAIIDTYGNPDMDNDFILDMSFVDHNLRIFNLPYPMRLSWNVVRSVERIQAHENVGLVMVDALKDILAFRGLDYLQDNTFDYYGGCFNFRVKRTDDQLSVHSWGIAIDINPHLAPMGRKSEQPDFIVKAFVDRGFRWGGNWLVPDGMHFQACRGY